MAIAKHNLQRRKPLRRAGRRLEWNPEPRDVKKLLFANILGLTGVSDNHSPTESRCNPALASQIDPSTRTSGFLQNVGLHAYEIQQSKRGAGAFAAPFLATHF